MLSLLRAIKLAFQQFRRNLGLSIVTITLLVLPLLLVNLIFALSAITETAINGIEEKIDVSVYFKSSASNENAQEIRDVLLEMPQVQEAVFTSQEGSLERFKSRHIDDSVILESLEELGENPFGATLTIKAKSIDDYPSIMAVLGDETYSQFIEEKNFDDHRVTIAKINTIMKSVKKFGFGIASVFGIIAALIVINSIRVAIYSHREEIGIMRLVGASSWFIRGPFLIEALLFSFLSLLVVLLILYPGINFVQPYINNLFEGMEINLLGYFNSNFVKIFGGQLAAVALLSFLSTGFAMRRYLRV